MNSAGYKNAADQRENAPGGRADDRRGRIAKAIHEMDQHEPSPKMAVTIADALRAYSEVLAKDAVTYAKHAAHTSLAEETKQRAEKLVKLADAIMDAF